MSGSFAVRADTCAVAIWSQPDFRPYTFLRCALLSLVTCSTHWIRSHYRQYLGLPLWLMFILGPCASAAVESLSILYLTLNKYHSIVLSVEVEDVYA